MARIRKIDITITEPILLSDLRWLVEACKNFDQNSTVTIKEHKQLSPVDWDEASVTVHGREDVEDK